MHLPALPNPLDRLGNAGKCMISTLFPYFLWQLSIPTPIFKFIIFKIILVCLLLWSTYVVGENIEFHC